MIACCMFDATTFAGQVILSFNQLHALDLLRCTDYHSHCHFRALAPLAFMMEGQSFSATGRGDR